MLPNQNTTTINVLVVGDASAGKTELLLRYSKINNLVLFRIRFKMNTCLKFLKIL